MRRLKIKHLTVYEYSRAVEFLPHKLLLRPREGHDIRIQTSRLQISPAHNVKWHRDLLDNCVAVVNFLEAAAKLSIFSEVVIENYEESPLDFLIERSAVNFPFDYAATEGPDLAPYQMPTYPEDSKALHSWINQFWSQGWRVETYVLLDNINKAIAAQIQYQAREEPGVQSPAQTLSKKRGSCRDMATLFIESCRHIGLAARFVSGYQLTPTSETALGATHAWSEIYLPGAGWKGFDSSSGKVVGNQYISVAVSRHPEAVPPIAGAFLGILNTRPVMSLKVEVTEIN
ncbi:MAG: transglutaminase family protein [Gammaproteobacteria bacterium]|nr:transglutaminase family protein [Gammaproteobacteria bacterium]